MRHRIPTFAALICAALAAWSPAWSADESSMPDRAVPPAPQLADAPPDAVAAPAAPVAQPVVPIAARPAPRPESRRMTLMLGKAKLIELPRPARDVLIANPQIADVVVKTPTSAFVVGNRAGDTNAYFLDEEGGQILQLDINVQLDVETLRQALVKGGYGDLVAASALNDQVVLTGTVPNAAVAAEIVDYAQRFAPSPDNVVNRIVVSGGQQVMIKVQVAEVSRQIAKEFGGNFQVFGPDVDFGSFTGITGDGFLDVTGLAVGDFRAQFFLDALERQGLAKILAEPNLTALSGQTAEFQAGGQFAYLAPDNDPETNFLIYQFRDFGVNLRFTPIVLSSGRISLKVFTEVSAPSQAEGLSVPTLETRRVETTVEIPSGGAMAIAGLIRNNYNATNRGVPGVKDIPLVGAVAGSRTLEADELELVIMITPYVVGPTHPDQIALPTDGLAPVSDVQLYAQGKLVNDYVPTAVQAIDGPVGFMLP